MHRHGAWKTPLVHVQCLSERGERVGVAELRAGYERP